MSFLNRRSFLASVSATLGSLSLSRKRLLAEPASEMSADPARPDVLWYETPAKNWVDAMPIGNGSLGAMVFGGGEDASPEKEFLQLNDDTLWSGYPKDGNNPDAPHHLAEVRKAVMEQKDYHLADALGKLCAGL